METKQIGDYTHNGQPCILESCEINGYAVIILSFVDGFSIGNGGYKILGISHLSGESRHDFKDFQDIKNQVCGEDWEGIELYPAESRLILPGSRFFMWCVPGGVIGWGIKEGENGLDLARVDG